MTAAATVSAVPAGAATPTTATAETFTVSGAGFGHGVGMSQYGAYGAAKSGLSWRRILRFYYPGTSQVQQQEGTTIKVWISADRDNDLRVLPAAGLRLRDSGGHSHVLPTGADRTAWRVTRSGTGFALSYRTASGHWAKQATGLGNSTWWFSDTAHVVKVWLPGGSRRELRGRVGLVGHGTEGRTVNRVRMEDYVRGVVPAEMPTSWPADAVRVQAVAARSYAARLKASARAGTGYDLCDTANCQVYRGMAATSGRRRTIFENTRGDAAVKATERTILSYGGTVALTQFASSNGGSSAKGGYRYLVAQLDPYEALAADTSWTRQISAATVARLWPAAGEVVQLKVTRRDGSGRWGGRATSVTLVGSRRDVLVDGSTFASRFGLRSRLFTFGNGGHATTTASAAAALDAV